MESPRSVHILRPVQPPAVRAAAIAMTPAPYALQNNFLQRRRLVRQVPHAVCRSAQELLHKNKQHEYDEFPIAACVLCDEARLGLLDTAAFAFRRTKAVRLQLRRRTQQSARVCYDDAAGNGRTGGHFRGAAQARPVCFLFQRQVIET